MSIDLRIDVLSLVAKTVSYRQLLQQRRAVEIEHE